MTTPDLHAGQRSIALAAISIALAVISIAFSAYDLGYRTGQGMALETLRRVVDSLDRQRTAP